MIKARAAEHYQKLSEWSKKTYETNKEKYKNGKIEYKPMVDDYNHKLKLYMKSTYSQAKSTVYGFDNFKPPEDIVNMQTMYLEFES